MNKKIQEQLQKLDRLVFELRMGLSALQNDLYESVTVSTTVPTTTLFDSPESQVEPDGFHGKSYADFEKHEEEQWKIASYAMNPL